MRNYIISFSMLLSSIIFTQVTEQWAARYNSPAGNVDEGWDAAVDNTGNVFVTGTSIINGNNDYVTIKYNSSGVQQWVQIYNGTGNAEDQARSIAVDNQGNAYVTGWSRGVNPNYDDVVTIKYSVTGTQEWLERYAPYASTDYGYSIVLDDSANVYVSGHGTLDNACIVIKYNSSGTQQWVAKYTGTGSSYGYDLKLDNERNICVTGMTVRNSPPNYDVLTVKFNPSGVLLWSAAYNGSANNDDMGRELAVDSSGNVYITGNSRESNSLDYVTIKYSPSGVQQWVALYNGSANLADIAYSIGVSSTGNVYVTGSSIGQLDDYLTIKYNLSGVQQWAARFNGSAGNSIDVAYSLALDASENIYVTGGSNGGSDDYATVKYNSSGSQQWVAKYTGPTNDLNGRAYSLKLDASNNVYITGRSKGSGANNFDVVTVKYSQSIGIKKISTEIPENFSLSQNYPNPFNPTTKFRIAIPSNVKRETSNMKIIIYDILGCEIQSLVNGQLQSGTYEVEWDGSNNASGVYYYMLSSGDYFETKKMVLIK